MSREIKMMAIACLGLSTAAVLLVAQAAKSDGPQPDVLPAKFVHPVGDAKAGQEVFRFETFNNQGFWTTAAQRKRSNPF